MELSAGVHHKGVEDLMMMLEELIMKVVKLKDTKLKGKIVAKIEEIINKSYAYNQMANKEKMGMAQGEPGH